MELLQKSTERTSLGKSQQSVCTYETKDLCLFKRRTRKNSPYIGNDFAPFSSTLLTLRDFFISIHCTFSHTKHRRWRREMVTPEEAECARSKCPQEAMTSLIKHFSYNSSYATSTIPAQVALILKSWLEIHMRKNIDCVEPPWLGELHKLEEKPLTELCVFTWTSHFAEEFAQFLCQVQNHPRNSRLTK